MKDAPNSFQTAAKPKVLNGVNLIGKQLSKETMKLIPPEISMELAKLKH